MPLSGPGGVATGFASSQVGAVPESIAKNYKRAFVFLHPDKWRNKPLKDQVWAEEVFKLISEASEPYRVPQLQEK